MKTTVILLGPHRVGKTAIGERLAERLDLPIVHFGEAAGTYWSELGHEYADQKRAWDESRMDGVYRYLMAFQLGAMEKGLLEHAGSIIETEPLQWVFDEPALLARAKAALQPFPHVFLLLPTPDKEESARILDERQTTRIHGMEINELFTRHHSNHDLAKQVVYTEGKIPEQTCTQVMEVIDPAAGEVFLIGPMGTGKSTIGRLLAEQLQRPQVSMDSIRWDYYKEIGWNEETQREISIRDGFAGIYRYWKPFEAYAVERALAEHTNCVLDFGVGHSVYEDESQFLRVQAVLAPHPNVVLLLPSPDLDESVRILRERGALRINGLDMNRFVIQHRSHRALCTHVLYTEGKTPDETAEDALQLLSPGKLGSWYPTS